MSSDDTTNQPGSSDRPPELDEVLAELMRAIDAGERVDRAEWLERYADFSAELHEFFGRHARMEHLVRPLRQAAAHVLHVRCPHCHNPIELLEDAPLTDISCPSCGSSFSLVGRTHETQDRHVGRTIGHFELLDQVGVGQFGSVWKARDTKLDRIVAVKIPRKGQLDEAETELFLRDARSAAQLKHPNIASVHEVGKQDDTIYIVSDFIEGATLKEWIAAKQLTPREAAELCIKTAKALHHAHEAGVIHRDLKPGNIMMDTDGDPHIVDFGLAKREAGEITMTVEGQILGTPAYMSPEQARGEGHAVDRRADIYSLGVILFELLTGGLPFRGDKQMLIVQIVNDDPPSPRTLNSSVPRDLDTICFKCLDKEASRRYATARELSEDLSRWLAGEVIVARPLGPLQRCAKWAKRRPATAGLIAAMFVAAVAVSVAAVATWYNDRLDAALTDARAQRSKAESLLEAVDGARMNETRLRMEKEGLLEEAVLAKRAEEEARTEADQFLYLYRIALADRELAAGHVSAAKDILEECPSILRHWEWHYLYRKCHRHVNTTTLDAHDTQTYQVSFSPDGALLASAGHDGRVKLWNTTDSELLATLAGNDQAFYGAAFSADGRLLAAAGGGQSYRRSQPGHIVIWDVASRNVLKTLSGHSKAVYSVAFNPDGTLLVSASGDDTIRIWDVSSGNQVHQFECERSDVGAYCTFDPRGDLLAAGFVRAR